MVVVASGPLTSDDLANKIRSLAGDYLYFYDAIAPIVMADSIDTRQDISCLALWQGRRRRLPQLSDR